jgi:hypothetical protein
MARVPEGTRRFRLPSPRVQDSGRNGPRPGETAIPDVPPSLSWGALKPGSCNDTVGCMLADASQGDAGYQTRPMCVVVFGCTLL